MLGKANISELQAINLDQDTPIHPHWIREDYPDLVNTMHHALTSVEEFEHHGNKVRITTTYKIEINGQETMIHASIQQQGGVQCHSTPYTPYQTVSDLVKALLNNTPDACIPKGDGSHGSGNNHGHSHHA